MKYSPLKTIQKGSIPAILVVLVNLAIMECKRNQIEIPDEWFWNTAILSYAGYISLVNWIKNHTKKTKEEGQSVNPGGSSSS